MALMWSRPNGLSLGATWVTPATIWLCVVVSLPAAILGLASIGRGVTSNNPLGVLAGILGLCLATGVGTVAVFGIRQRLLRPR